MKEDADELLMLRASLGRWQHPSGLWKHIKCTQESAFESGRQYKVREFLQSYKPTRTFKLSEGQVRNTVKKLRQSGYRLTEPTFPELQEYFRDGEPITGATMVSDFITDIKPAKKSQTGLEAMLEAFNSI